ncbi:MAG: hypothetical protein HYV93_15755 [Candidatus Rokubacteria bacterium]|nr:hypothetical protein [Candidatus Rokubacteria bacterium]
MRPRHRTGLLLLALCALVGAAALTVSHALAGRVLEQSLDYPGSEGDMPAHL